MKLVKPVKYFFLITVPAILAVLLIIELVFRFAIPASNPPHAYFDPEGQIFRYDVNGPRTGTYSFGKLAQLRGKWRVNNAGWLSEIDYVAQGREKPLVAIIGDSMVAALQVDAEDSLAGKVRSHIGDEYDVYSFGTPGAPLSQYLHMSRYVNATFDPDILVFNVVHNDFNESLCEVTSRVGMMCLEDRGPEIAESAIVPYTPSRVRRLAHHSSLVRYVFLNLKAVVHFPRGGGEEPPPSSAQVGDAPAAALPNRTPTERPERIDAATGYVLGKIAEENPGKPVAFMIDGLRRSIYSGDAEENGHQALKNHKVLQTQSRNNGFVYIDLTESFSAS